METGTGEVLGMRPCKERAFDQTLPPCLPEPGPLRQDSSLVHPPVSEGHSLNELRGRAN